MKTASLRIPVIAWLSVVVLAASATAVAAGPADPIFEKGYVPVGELKYSYLPNLARLRDGTILCAYAHGQLPRLGSIRVTATQDGGRSWSKAVLAIPAGPQALIADPNMLVVGERASESVKLYGTWLPSMLPPFGNARFWESTSTDGGRTWSKHKALPSTHRYMTGKVHVPITLRDGTIVMGYAWDVPAERGKPAQTEPEMLCKPGVLRSTDGGQTWKAGADVSIDRPLSLDEPAPIELKDGSLLLVMRTIGPRPYEVLSHDGGLTWGKPRESSVDGHNTPTALLRLADGSILRAWDMSTKNRYPLVVALSTDEAKTWSTPRTVTTPTTVNPATAKPDAKTSQGGLSYRTACYPSLAQCDDGTILMVWWETGDFGSRLGYARFNRAWVERGA